MPSYTAPIKDLKFLLKDVHNIFRYSNLPGFSDLSEDLMDQMLDGGAKITQEVWQPLNASGDKEGCRFENGQVLPPKGFKEAYKAYCEGGWPALALPADIGGAGLPYVLSIAMTEMATSANQSLGMYSGLTNGAIWAIYNWGEDHLKQAYLPKMVSGEWSGTMNLTEPHCGTDLGLIRTKAEPLGDGSYAITGTKIFISAGDHDFTSNIIHLVLARLPDAPAGIKGISLFLVPKFKIDAQGKPAGGNGVSTGSIEHKMGINGNSTCVLNYDKSQGWLLGEPHKGMRAMFTMMNEARLGVAIQGLGQSEVSTQNAVAYAKDRLQGRSLKGPAAPEKPADPIIVHPDIRRSLLTAKAFNEAARSLAVEAGLYSDLAHRHPDEMVKRDAEDYLALMTPILKAYLTDKGFENTVNNMQVLGGHGYIREWGMEQFVRDARITQIYEGANGIQALDLIGRKMPAHFGRPLRQFFHPVDAFIRENGDNDALGEFIMPLAQAFGRLQQAAGYIAEKGLGNMNDAAAGATDFLHMFGNIALGFQWCKMAKVCLEKLAAGNSDKAFYETKLKLARFYMERILPETAAQLRKITSGSKTMMSFAEGEF